MCVSSEPADFSSTTVAVSQAIHPTTGKPVHVLAYKNTAANLAGDRRNALVLHFPAARPMTSQNVVDTSAFPRFTQDMVDALRPPQKNMRSARSISLSAGVEVFDTGIYTVVLASNARMIAAALPQVPEHKRPRLNRELFNWYARMWPNWPIALCCFNNTEAVNADPLLWWYEPLDTKHFMAPAIDSHTGGVPNLSEFVDTDHWVIAGLQESREGFVRVHYTDEHRIPAFARALLPNYVAGSRFRQPMQNGDFWIPVGHPDLVHRRLMQ